MTIDITEQNFDEMIKSSDKLILVDFWASWCNPCKALAPCLEDASNDLSEKIVVFKVNIDENPDLPQKYSIRGIPTIIFFKSGEVVDRQVGVLAKQKLYEKIEDVASKL